MCLDWGICKRREWWERAGFVFPCFDVTWERRESGGFNYSLLINRIVLTLERFWRNIRSPSFLPTISSSSCPNLTFLSMIGNQRKVFVTRRRCLLRFLMLMMLLIFIWLWLYLMFSHSFRYIWKLEGRLKKKVWMSLVKVISQVSLNKKNYKVRNV